jgi:predicted DNA binding protein
LLIDVQEGESDDISELGGLVKNVAESDGKIVEVVNLAESKYELLKDCTSNIRYNDLKALNALEKDPNKNVHPVIKEDLPKIRRAHVIILTFAAESKISAKRIEEYLTLIKQGKGLGGKKRVAYFVASQDENVQSSLSLVRENFKKNILSMGYKPAKFTIIKKSELTSEYTRGNIHYDFKNMENTEYIKLI